MFAVSKTPLMPDDGVRAGLARWLEEWKVLGPILERDRRQQLEAMSDAEARSESAQLLDLWRPEWPTDEGEELLLHQRVFARAHGSRGR